MEYHLLATATRSIGGLSGSPVFISLGKGAWAFEGDPHQPVSLLLGLVRGHWDYQTRLASMDYADDELNAVNMGIAIIIPIQEALKIINGDELMKVRRQTDRELQKQKA